MAKAAAKKQEQRIEHPIPTGFKRVNALSDISTWWKPQERQAIQGVLLGRFERQGAKQKGKFYYQLKVTDVHPEGSKGPTVALRDKIEIDVEKGAVVNFDERERLKELAQYCGTQEQYEVYIFANECIELKNGNTMWTFEIGAKVAPDNIPF